MIPDKVIYTDGRDVTVTDSTFQVKNHEYKLNGITRCVLYVMKPERTPAILLILVGLGLIVCGFLNVFSVALFSDVSIGNNTFSANVVASWLGGILALIGILVLAVVKERYAVRIATAEGEKDAVVSSKKEYVTQIVDAINQAVSFVRTKTASRYFTLKGSS
ncbi:MAG TPA: DUF6232 family protein [Ohtaekwangia sp.]|nr:DUF6232 family protein [Ohtaekwangia sp.]